MEFLDPEKKKQHNRRLLAGYVLIAIAVMLAALILFLQSSGYDLDRKTGKVIQNGLIFVSSHPESAKVYLNGSDQGGTDVRLTVPEGSYTVELKRDGYRDWKRTINLEGSSIERLQYPVLFPATLKTKDQTVFNGAPQFITQSPDRHWLLVTQPGSVTDFLAYDSNNPSIAPLKFSLPANVLTATNEAQTLKLVEWSTDNRHLLVTHSFKDQSEYIMIDRDTPANSINLTKTFNIVGVKLALRDKKADQLYLFDDAAHILKTVDVKSKQITTLLSNVLAYKSYGSDTLFYAQIDSKDAAKTNIRLRDNDKDYTVRTYTTPSTYLLDLTRFDNHWYMVIGSKDDGRVAIYRDPVDAIKTDAKTLPLAYSVLIMKDAQFVSFSANARFIMVQNGSRFGVYDAETNKRFYYELNKTLASEQKATWVDGHRILANADNKVVVFDFDGINQQTLVPVQSGTLPYFDRDYTRLYALGPSVATKDKTALTETPLKLNIK